MLETQGLAFGFDLVERGNGTVFRGHKQHVGTPVRYNAKDALVEGDHSQRTRVMGEM